MDLYFEPDTDKILLVTLSSSKHRGRIVSSLESIKLVSNGCVKKRITQKIQIRF